MNFSFKLGQFYLFIFLLFTSSTGYSSADWCNGDAECEKTEGAEQSGGVGSARIKDWWAPAIGQMCAQQNANNAAEREACKRHYINRWSSDSAEWKKCAQCVTPASPENVERMLSCVSTVVATKKLPVGLCGQQKQEDPPPKKEEPQPEPEGPPSAYDPQCKQQLDKMYSQCKEQTAPVAAQKCDPAKNEELMKNKQTALAALQMASMATGMNDPCSKISMAMDATGAGVAAFMRTCNEARVNCTNACQDVVDKIDDTKGCALKTPQNQNPDNKGLPEINEMSEIANRNIGACGEQGTYAKRESEAPQIMAQLMNAGSKAKACADATKGYGKNSLADPCMGPGAATNPMCIGINGGGGPSPIGGGDTPGGFRAGGNDRSGLGVAAGDRGFEMPNGPSGPGLNMGDGSGAGGSGGGPKAGIGAGGMGSGLSSGSGGDESGAGGSTESKGMYSGYRSNGVGGAAGGGHGGGAAGNAGLPGGQQGKFGPDLNKYLPGGSFDPKRRGIAGATGPDGITGPHTNIWEKISNRYQATTESLLP